MNRGKFCVLALLGASMTLAVGGILYRRSTSRPVIAWWGIEAVELVRTAPEAELLVLVLVPRSDAATDRRELADDGLRTIGATVYRVDRRIALSSRPGVVHLRHALLEAVTYRFQEQPPDRPEFRYALRFRDGDRHVEFLFDPERAVMADGEGGHQVVLGAVGERIRKYLDEQIR